MKVAQLKRYAVVFERTGTGYSAYLPDLPGCISTGRTLEDARRNIREAAQGHLAAMVEDGDAVPEPTTVAGDVEIELP